jgi:hypothetical protein
MAGCCAKPCSLIICSILAMIVLHKAAADVQLPASTADATWTADSLTIHRQTSDPVLIQALRNTSITTITFQVPYFALHSAWDSMAPVVIDRNVTVKSSSDPPTVLEMRFLPGHIILGRAVEFIFQTINLADDK